MKKVLRYLTNLMLMVLLFGKVNAQDTTTINYLNQIKAYDLSIILTTDSISTEDREDGTKEIFKRDEILGFIGEDYQRFYIHLVSVIQNPANPYEYLVSGKTKVKETICSFQGKLQVKQARVYKHGDNPSYKQGFAIYEVALYEDKKQPSAGFIRGKLTTEFVIDNNSRLKYDALMLASDGFANNQFVGYWTSYKTNASKKCNWGDYRIPDCGDLDIGAGEFSINDKYLKNGWENYRQAYVYVDSNKLTSKHARQKEGEQWWK